MWMLSCWIFVYYTCPVLFHANSILWIPREIGLVFLPIVMYEKVLCKDMDFSIKFYHRKVSLFIFSNFNTFNSIQLFHHTGRTYFIWTILWKKIFCDNFKTVYNCIASLNYELPRLLEVFFFLWIFSGVRK